MKNFNHPGVTALLLLLANLNNSLIGALDLSGLSGPITGVQMLEPDSNGDLTFIEENIDVFSFPPDSLKRMTLIRVNLTWDNTKPSQLESLEELELVHCELNPNSITFSESFVDLRLDQTKLVNGTLWDLLKSATHLQILDLSSMSKVDLLWDDSKPPVYLERLEELQMSDCFFNPNSITFGESLTSLILHSVKFTNGTLVDMFKTVTNLIHLEMRWMQNVDISKLLFPPFQIFDNKFVSLTLQETELINGTLHDILNMATGLQSLVLVNSGELDLFKLNLSTESLFLYSLQEFTISETKLVHGTIFDLLKNARRLKYFRINDMGEFDISNWHFNKSDNSSLQFYSLPEDCKIFHIENTKLANGNMKDILKNAKSLQNLTIDGIGEVDFSERGGSNFLHRKLFDKLIYLRMASTTLIGITLHDVLKTANNVQHLEISQTSDIDWSDLFNLSIWKRLKILWIGKTTFVNGNLYDLLNTTSNLQALTIDNMGKVDISQIQAEKLKSLQLTGVTLTRSRPSEVLRFQNLQTLTISESDAEDSRTLFDNFDQMFPKIDEIDTGSQLIIVHPKALLSVINSSATSLNFSFDFDPPVKTFEFGEAMKKLIAAGYIHGEYADSLNNILNKGVSSLQRVHLLSLKRTQFTHSEWRVYLDFTSYGFYSGTTDDIKPVETKAVIYTYFLFLLVFIGIGTTGDFLSGIVLFKTKMENSATVILLALTFLDTGVILTYLASAYFNAELFYRIFIATGSKSTVYAADEHLWLTEQHSVVAFFIYPLNKTFYSASVYTTLLISVERFAAVCSPLKSKYLLCRRNSIHAIMAILIFSVLLNIPRWIESYEWNTYPEDSPNWNDFYKPTLMRMESYRTIYHGWVWVTFMYILPFIFVVVLNFKIIRQTKLSNQLRRTLQSGTHELTEHASDMSSLTRMLLCVVTVFVVCNSVHIAIVFYFFASYEQIQLSTTEAVSCLPIVINCSVNFLIYIFLGKKLRAEFLKLLPECARRFCHTSYRRDMT